MSAPRTWHTATLLGNGKVLIAGGGGVGAVFNTAEIYDPFTGQFSGAGPLNSPRWFHSATLLTNGKVLISGGSNGATDHNTAEVYDPVTNTFTSTGIMIGYRLSHHAILLGNGMVLIAGGSGGNAGGGGGPLQSTELYDPSTNSFTASINTTPYAPQITPLSNSALLISGGIFLDQLCFMWSFGTTQSELYQY